MATIVCPHCHETFDLESSDYLEIVAQVRTAEFDREVKQHGELVEEQKASALAEAAAQAQVERERAAAAHEKALAEKDSQIALLQERLEGEGREREAAVRDAKNAAAAEREKSVASLEQQITRLQEQLKAASAEKDAAVRDAVAQASAERMTVERERDGLAAQLRQSSDAVKLSEERARAAAEAEKIRHDSEIQRLEAQVQATRDAGEQQRALAVSEATGALREKIASLEGAVRQKEAERSEVEARLREQLGEAQKSQAEIVRIKDEEIERLKDYRMRMTVKMTGESLEQHCQQEFNRWRSQNPSAFRNIYFEKDNEAVEGTKGDFIYRETDDEGNEILSIMFEMKNEELSSTNKKTNESHLAKLDRDRAKKGCEYAVLVSMLELDSEYYNQGIVDMSYRYDKMFVVRPQFFMLMIALLRNGAQKSVDLRRQIAQMQNEQVDITNFESALGDFQQGFGRNVDLARRKFDTAIEEIDKTIQHLQKVRENLVGSSNNLRLADDKAQGLTIKKLTKNSPLLAERFEAQRQAEKGGLPE